MTITEFLKARIAEDEERNNPAPDPSGSCDYLHGVHYESARVLAECAAKRAITKAHSNITVWPDGTGGAKYYTGSKEVCASCDERTLTPCPTIRALAAVYADHADFRQEWAL